jgi:DNA-binding NtrC family response regulator
MKPSLMIVDDAKTIHLVMNEMFENEFELLHASNLSEARMSLKESSVDLII